ncbi:hypothetical protein [Nonomuraea basaltis]|uniref:hypothetical protein n=1 Tax=Nonomuraea basaltis TaxID=2495887 RepID=UPI00110C40A3|nr:hypothetical protein [Nonomuraea basaltis]TMR99541.1 hypothetical protein EJK15_06930 [Nonomuraea basaltis]
MNPIKRGAAYVAVELTQQASQAFEEHRAACAACMKRTACDTLSELQKEVYVSSQTSRTALLMYASRGSNVEYHGAAVHLHGVWRVTDTCRKSLHTTYLLHAERSGAIIDDVSLDDIRQPIEPEPSGMLAAVRRAVAEITRLLAACGFLLHVRVTQKDGTVRVEYDAVMFQRYDEQARFARQHGTGIAQEDAAYVVDALKSLRNMSALARTGALHTIYGVVRSAGAARGRVETRATRRPRA